jgi:hypothetical protein
MKRVLPTLFVLSIATSFSPAAADVWLELLNAPCWTGDAAKADKNGVVHGSIDPPCRPALVARLVQQDHDASRGPAVLDVKSSEHARDHDLQLPPRSRSDA